MAANSACILQDKILGSIVLSHLSATVPQID